MSQYTVCPKCLNICHDTKCQCGHSGGLLAVVQKSPHAEDCVPPKTPVVRLEDHDFYDQVFGLYRRYGVPVGIKVLRRDWHQDPPRGMVNVSSLAADR